MTDLLTDIQIEFIKKNWLNYKNDINYSRYYNLLWSNLENKFNIKNDDLYLNIFKKFIYNNDIFIYEKLIYDNRIHIEQITNDIITLKGLDSQERKNIHILCDKIGLHHDSRFHPKKLNKKILYIIKPLVWLWEFTEKNPYSKSPDFYEKCQIEKELRLQKIKEKLTHKYCNICNVNGWEKQLFHSVYIKGLYCNNCLDNSCWQDILNITCRETGTSNFLNSNLNDNLNDHKFEPLYYN